MPQPKRICSFLGLVLSFNACAQALPPSEQLPDWVQSRWKVLAAEKGLEISTRINPFVWRADFDGDRRQDFAVLVKSSKSGKEGMAIFARKTKAPYLLGAGTEFGNGGDDFSWIDLWSIEEQGTVQRSHYAKTVKLQSDGVLVAKEGSASALIYLKAGKPTWQQQGD